MSPHLTRFAALAAASLSLVAAGCGGGDDDEKEKAAVADVERAAVQQVLVDLRNASRIGDAVRICNEIFTPKLADSVTRSSEFGSCTKEVRRKVFDRNADIQTKSITVNGPSDAQAVITQNARSSNVFFVKQAGRWRIRSVQPAK